MIANRGDLQSDRMKIFHFGAQIVVLQEEEWAVKTLFGRSASLAHRCSIAHVRHIAHLVQSADDKFFVE